jgi:dissimilatory sulfite reductase (desulfoviridin) alpha/beta subunit
MDIVIVGQWGAPPKIREEALEEVEKMGFPVGGWGPTLWGINSCTAYLTHGRGPAASARDRRDLPL